MVSINLLPSLCLILGQMLCGLRGWAPGSLCLPGPMGGHCGHQAEGCSSAASVSFLPQSKSIGHLQEAYAVLQECIILVNLKGSWPGPPWSHFSPALSWFSCRPVCRMEGSALSACWYQSLSSLAARGPIPVLMQCRLEPFGAWSWALTGCEQALTSWWSMPLRFMESQILKKSLLCLWSYGRKPASVISCHQSHTEANMP
jgi:hypothetical protein